MFYYGPSKVAIYQVNDVGTAAELHGRQRQGAVRVRAVQLRVMIARSVMRLSHFH